MKEKITLPGLVANLAIRSGKSKKQCEDFLRELFNAIEQTLTEGEILKIKGLGTFKIIKVEPRKSVDVNTGEDIEIPGHNKVSFIPAKELADVINAPFSMFDSVEINSDEDRIETDDDSGYEAGITDKDEENKESEEENNKTTEETSDQEDYNNINSAEINQIASDSLTEEAEAEEMETAVLENEDDAYEITKPKKFRFLFGFLTGVACTLILIVGLGFLFFKDALKECSLFSQSAKTVKTETISNSNEIANNSIQQISESADSTKMDSSKIVNQVQPVEDEAMVPTAASDQVVYDTISKTRYLTTMAKVHYGNYNLWPYIYIENQKILGHPDRIKPGTKVVVPPLSKYNVNPANKADIEVAKQKGLEIYKRFQ